MEEFSHIGANGVHMVNVVEKEVTLRVAEAVGFITMKPETQLRIREGGIKKGDIFTVAQLAGIMAAKKTSDLIPLTHNIPLDDCKVSFEYIEDDKIMARSFVTATAKTGAEMEAITAVSLALITIYDMAKAIDKGMVITDIRLEYKSGGKSGVYNRGKV